MQFLKLQKVQLLNFIKNHQLILLYQITQFNLFNWVFDLFINIILIIYIIIKAFQATLNQISLIINKIYNLNKENLTI